jgi:RimJ/RimL family protein N-acetyltransferase
VRRAVVRLSGAGPCQNRVVPGVLVRPLRPQDVDEALDMFAAVAAEGLWIGSEAGFDRSARRARWLADLDDPAGRSLVVQESADGRIVGNGRVQLAPYGVAELGMVLAPQVRGRGIGGRLLDRLVVAAAQLGAHKVDLQVWPHNEPAVRLYLSRGFVVEGRFRAHYRRANGQLWDAILMGLPLPHPDGAAAAGSLLPDAPSLPHTIQISAGR